MGETQPVIQALCSRTRASSVLEGRREVAEILAGRSGSIGKEGVPCPVPKGMVRPSTARRYRTFLLLTRVMNPEILHREGHGNKFALSLGLSMPNWPFGMSQPIPEDRSEERIRHLGLPFTSSGRSRGRCAQNAFYPAPLTFGCPG